MKNKKGFTLIELLGVVTVLALILTIVAPKIFSQFKIAEQTTDKEQINAIIESSKIYMNQNTELLPEGNNEYVITLDELKESGIIQTNQILNPSTKQELTGCVVVKFENNKYKYEYKEENDCNNVITVTFNPQGGQITQTSKQVKYNESYGSLPTPTREGYTFMGWTSKNLAPEINESNYTFYHHQKTTNEFKSENGANYIRINGIWTENIDTMWIIRTAKKIRLNQGEYTLSFDVRSQNALTTQSIGKIIPGSGNTQGRTGIYNNQSMPFVATNILSNIENNYNFDNDGEWHHFTSKVIIPYDTSDALIAIGNDAPNLCGENSYIDIKNIQLEPGNTATSYEPYLGDITSDTIVTRGENHTLYAIWQANS